MTPFTLERPRELGAALAMLQQPGARVIAGGTTLYDLMKLGVEVPERLIDISGIDGLKAIDVGGDTLRFGALALMSDVAAIPVIRDDYPILRDSLLRAASQQLRNMATVGGNLLQRTRCVYFRNGASGIYPCNKRLPGSGCAAIGGLDRGQAILGTSDACTAVSPGDWPVALVAMDAQVELAGSSGQRTIPVADLYRLPNDRPDMEFTLQPGEIITAVNVPKTTAGRRSVYLKIRDRESYAFALTSAAVALDMEGGTVRRARIALGGVATIPWRAKSAEQVLEGKPLKNELARSAAEAAFADARPGKHNCFKTELGIRTLTDAIMQAAGASR